MLLWVLAGSGIVVGFHFILRRFKVGKSELSTGLHPIRRLQHVLTGVLILLIYSFASHEQGRMMITVPAVLFYLFDLVRRKGDPAVNKWFLKHWKNLLRPHEISEKPTAACFFLMGIAVVFWITSQREITQVAILNVSLCDPAASVFGILFGRVLFNIKI
jgi:dolichol kinase